MKLYNRISLWLFAVVLALVGGQLQAQPEYAGTTFEAMQEVTDDASLFFGVIVALAIVVTGFFLGRKWLRSVG